MFKVTAFDPKLLSWWRSKRDKIDMDPPYQRRGRLWSNTDKAYLIDSILNGFDVPKLYIADFTWGRSKLNRKRLPYAIIDGKQRFEAILDFYDGHVVLNSDFVYLANRALKLSGLSYSDLKHNYPEIASDFDNYNLSVMSVIADKEEPITELFVRLNRSKPLTGAEIRNAMTGPAPEVFRQIAKHEFFTTCVRFAISRGQDLNAAAKLVLFEYSGQISETKKRSLDEFTIGTKKKPRGKLELAGRRVVDVLDEMVEIFLPGDSLLGSAGIIPVYYWLVRNRKSREFPYLREFLVRFEEDRRINRDRIRDGEGKASNELSDYDTYNRSTNDGRSHEERYRILSERFTRSLRATKN